MSTQMHPNTTLYFVLRKFTKAAYRVKGIGLGRVCEGIRRYASRHSPSTPLIVDDFRGDAKFRCFLREHMGGQIFFRGSYSSSQLPILERHLSEQSVFLDLGANQGEFSIAAARIAKRGKVIAFEPVAEYRDRLLENAKLNQFTNIVAVPVALGDSEGSVPIYDDDSSFFDGTRNEGVTSLFATEGRNHAREYVAVRRLDDVLKDMGVGHVDVMKLDVEGGEWAALKGAINTILQCRPILILEVGRETCRAAGYEAESFVAWIERLDYRLERIDDDGKTSSLDIAALGDYQNIVAYPR